jgi:hypothetical protein
MLGARSGRGYHGASDSISCSAGLQTAEEAVGSCGATWQDHRVPECRHKEVSLGTGDTARVVIFTQPVATMMRRLCFIGEQGYGS